MTLKELNSIRHIDNEISRYEEEMRRLREESERITLILSSQPKASGKSDKVGECASAIADLQCLIEATYLQRINERHRIHKYINEIPDSDTRKIFQYRFIDCLTWNEVADKIDGSGTLTDKNVSQICYRYINGTENE